MAITSPDDISGMIRWFFPHQESYSDSAGTTAAVVDGVVGNVPDLTGTAADAIQSTEANKPLLKQDGAGWNYLQYDGSNDVLVSSTAVGSQPFSLVIAGALGGIATQNPFVGEAGSTNMLRGRDSRNWRLIWGTPLDLGTPDTSFHVLQGLVNGASSELIVDGSSAGTGDAGSSSWSGGVELGRGGSSGFYLLGDLYWVGIWNKVLNSTEIGDLDTYLSDLFSNPPPSGGSGSPWYYNLQQAIAAG